MSILGIDVGGVIIDRANDGTDTSFFSDNFLRTTAVPGAFEAITRLNAEVFDEVHVVSKCGHRIEQKTRHWLEHHDFFRLTGIPADRLHFVRTRPEKAPVCSRLGVTDFVDDRLDVLVHLTDVCGRYLFLGGGTRLGGDQIPGWAVPVETWQQLLDRLAPRRALA